jgi:TonB family protein
MFPPRCILISLFLPAFLLPFAQVQGPIAPPSAPVESAGAYPNSSDGLRSQLLDILAAAKDHDHSKLESLIKKMQIPNYEDWFTGTYGEVRGERLASEYARNLANLESDLQAVFKQLATEEGSFTFRRPNEARAREPSPGVNAPSMGAQLDPADPFLVIWRNQGASKPDVPVGSFVYLDGTFRRIQVFRFTGYPPGISTFPGLSPEAPTGQASHASENQPDRTRVDGPVRPGVRIASWATCEYCPTAEYTDVARRKHLEGTVLLQTIVQPDGSPTDIQVLKSPDPELSRMAMDSVSRWRFKPARSTDGEAVQYKLAIEVTFQLAR